MITNSAAIIDEGGRDEEAKKELQLEKKIAIATDGIQQQYFANQLRRLKQKRTSSKIAIGKERQNLETICDYIIAMIAEINPSIMHRANQLQVLYYLSEFHHNQKLFSNMTRADVVEYLDSLRKPEESDPYHKWKGTYNLRRIFLKRFFKWLYYPNLEPNNRPTPEVISNIPQLKRKEQSTIKPSDLWTAEDDTLFLKYCDNKRDKAYHAIARDSSCRPSEILGLRIRDLHFKTTGTSQYAEIVVNGKTGTRSIPLFSAIPYVKDWLDNHPQGRNPNAFLIPTLDRKHKRFGNRMRSSSLNILYKRYKKGLFPALLKDPKVIPEDKQKIRDLLLKPFNPYVFRHSALTVKSTILKEHVLRQHAGWKPGSAMPNRYLHYFGNESSESLLAEYGIISTDSKGQRLLPDTLKPKVCPHCNESNIPDCKFCSRCRMVLNYDAYEETIEDQKKKDSKLKELEDKINLQQQAQEEQKRLQQEQIQAQAVQQSLLEAIAKTMNIHNNGIMERDLKDKKSNLNADEFKTLTYKKKLQAITEIKQDTNKVIQTILLPEIANISKNMKENNVDAVNDSIARIVLDKGFREMFFDIADIEIEKEIEKKRRREEGENC